MPHSWRAELSGAFSGGTVPSPLLLLPRWLVPVRPRGALENHALLVVGDRIAAIGPREELLARHPEVEAIRLDTHVLLPGFVNSHAHAAMSLLRGLADDLPLMTWLERHIWPAESRFVYPDFVRMGTRLAIAEMLAGGTTCFNDMYFFPSETALVAMEMGMRASVGHVVIDFPNTYTKNAEDALQKAQEHLTGLRGFPLVKQGIAPHAPYTVSDWALQEAAALARQEDLFLHMHVHETSQEIASALERDGRRPLHRLAGLGVLDSRFLAVHMTHLDASDLALCAETGIRVAHCPESNLKLGSGISPVSALLRQGQKIGIGTDGAASNNDLDMLGELRTAALLAKGREQDPTVLPAMDVLEMATLGGAVACGWEEETGSLETGKAADCIAINLDRAATSPVYDPVSQVVYCAGRDQVSHVWVAGRLRISGGLAVDWEEREMVVLAREWARRIAEKDGAR